MAPVDPNSGVSQTPVVQNGQVSQTPSQDSVSQGFSRTNSVSSSDSGDSSQTVSVSPDQPGTSNADSRDFLQRAFDAKLDGFRAAVHEFNRRFNAQDIDINDTQSLILIVKGMISDTQALVSAASIDQAFGNRAYEQSKRQDSANSARSLRGAIRTRTQDLTDKTAQRDTRAGDLANKNLSKTLKEHQLSDAQSSHTSENDNSEEITRLTTEITLLEHEIAGITTETNTLNQQIQGLETSNATDSAALLRANRQLNSVTEEFVGVNSLLGRIRQRFDPAALETGEEGIQAVKELEQMVQKDQVREIRKRQQSKDEVKALDKQGRRDDIRVEDERIDREEGVDQYLTAEDLETLRLVFSPSDPAELRSATQRLDDQSQAERYPAAEEGFAIALNSAPSDKALEDAANPAAETHRGDNLSFEGASSPQVFARLWMEAKLEEGEETQDVKEDHLDEVADNADSQRKSVAENLQDFESIPLEVAESLEKQQEAAIQISKNNRV
ncbi:hypothetical protein [Endozoicomonas numazuensis]|uniref:Uncharacterized protein n=1 Tax=Endozoicomonas numazuensis TaxID=1137799 RepID=A0A081NE35_9GAMM|nr:hypothetical protein [Endozoicomonas numazuensis]KEQ16708.1 hypothetical protein GZ78_18585 [Endozoicomonas numazuensis]